MSSRPSATNRPRNRFARGRSTPFSGARPPSRGNGFGISKTQFFGKSKPVDPRSLTPAAKAQRAMRKAGRTNLATRQKGGFSSFSGGKSIFFEPPAGKSSARSAAAKARAPVKGSAAAMAVGARLRAAKVAKGKVISMFA